MKNVGIYFAGFVSGFVVLFALIMIYGDYDEPAIQSVAVAQGAMPTATPTTEWPTATPLPTSTPLPTATPAPRRPDMSDTEKLLRVHVGQAFANELLLGIAAQLQSGQMDSMQASFTLLAAQSILDGIEPGVTFPYFAPLSTHAAVAKTQQDVLRSVVRRWANNEITSATVPAELSSIDPVAAIASFADTLKASGIRQDEIERMVDSLDADMQAALTALQESP